MSTWNRKKKIMAFVMAFSMIATAVPEQSVQAAGKARVKGVKVTNVKGKTISLEKGKTKTLKVKVTAVGKGKVSQKVTFRSDNTKVVKVSNKGKLTAMKKGSAKVVITSKADKKKKFTLKVNVVEPDKDTASASPMPTQTAVPQVTQPVSPVPQTTQPASTEPQSTQPGATDQPEVTDQPTTPPQTTDEPGDSEHYCYLETINDEIGCIEDFYILWQDTYEVCLDGGDSWENCKDNVSVYMNETYEDDYDFEITYTDEDYASYSDLEKGSVFIEVGQIRIYEKADAEKKAVATYALKFRRRYNCIEGFEGGRIITCEVDIRDRSIDLRAFTDWKTNFGEDHSAIEDLIVQPADTDYLYRVDFEVPEDSQGSYAGMLYVYANSDVNKTNALTSFVIYCKEIPEMTIDTTELSKVRVVCDYSLPKPAVQLFITEDITKENVNDIIDKITFIVNAEGDFTMEDPIWYTDDVSDTYHDPYVAGTVVFRSLTNGDDGYCPYDVQCFGLCYITGIDESPLHVKSWQERDGFVTVRATEEYVADGEENSTLNRLKESIHVAEGYSFELTFSSVNIHDTQAYYHLKIYQEDELIWDDTISYEVISE